MSKNDLVAVFLYDMELSFEDVACVEAQIMECMEENLYAINATFLTTESLESSLQIRCELPSILPLHFLQGILDVLSLILPTGVNAKILLFNSALSTITLGIYENAEYSIKNIGSGQTLEHKGALFQETSVISEEILKKSILFLTMLMVLV